MQVSHPQVKIVELTSIDLAQMEQLTELLIQVVEDGASIGFCLRYQRMKRCSIGRKC